MTRIGQVLTSKGSGGIEWADAGGGGGVEGLSNDGTSGAIICNRIFETNAASGGAADIIFHSSSTIRTKDSNGNLSGVGSSNSGRYLRSTSYGMEWVYINAIFNNSLSYTETSGNTTIAFNADVNFNGDKTINFAADINFGTQKVITFEDGANIRVWDPGHNTYQSGTNGDVLTSTGTGMKWQAPAASSGGGGGSITGISNDASNNIIFQKASSQDGNQILYDNYQMRYNNGAFDLSSGTIMVIRTAGNAAGIGGGSTQPFSFHYPGKVLMGNASYGLEWGDPPPPRLK